jgi:hypothetical protein
MVWESCSIILLLIPIWGIAASLGVLALLSWGSFNKPKFGVTPTLPVIPLYQLEGYPNGQLAVELKRYAPELFENGLLD